MSWELCENPELSLDDRCKAVEMAVTRYNPTQEHPNGAFTFKFRSTKELPSIGDGKLSELAALAKKIVTLIAHPNIQRRSGMNWAWFDNFLGTILRETYAKVDDNFGVKTPEVFHDPSGRLATLALKVGGGLSLCELLENEIKNSRTLYLREVGVKQRHITSVNTIYGDDFALEKIGIYGVTSDTKVILRESGSKRQKFPGIVLTEIK